MRLKKLTTIIIASIISAVVLAVCLYKIVYHSNHYEISVTVQYGDGSYEEYIMEAGDTLLLQKTPEKEGYEFEGWYSDANYTQEYDFNNEVTRNTIIYAKMKKL